jgi:alkylation response protein AidB-like acyl-CoA dehydrogenase
VDFGFNEEQDSFRATIRTYLEKESPITRTRELFDDPLGFDPLVWRGGADLGWFTMLVPEDHGGGSLTGQGLVDAFLIAMEMGRTVQPGPFIPGNVVAFALSRFGSDAQRQDVLPGVISGDIVAGWCLPESGGVWGADGVTITAKQGGSGLVLDGEALVQDPQAVDRLLVAARDGDRIVQAVVPVDASGVTVTPKAAFDLTRRFGIVRFDGVAVPGSDVLPGGDAAAVDRELQIAIVLHVGESLGAIDRMLEMTVEYSKDRVQFGRPIGSFQAIKHRLANLYMLLESSRAAAYYAALAVEEQFDDADEVVMLAKAYVSDAFTTFGGETIQLHGGIGFTWEHDASPWRVAQNVPPSTVIL